MAPSFRARGAHLRLPLTLLAAASLAACSSVSLQEPAARSVTIERTAHGIPHITASDYEGIAFGVAYAYAQDTVCQTADQLITVRGERTQFFGPQASGRAGVAHAGVGGNDHQDAGCHEVSFWLDRATVARWT